MEKESQLAYAEVDAILNMLETEAVEKIPLKVREFFKNEKDKKQRETLKLKLKNFKEKTKTTFIKDMMERGCLGQISEIYDSKPPYSPKGTIAQSWSVAEVFRIIYGRD